MFAAMGAKEAVIASLYAVSLFCSNAVQVSVQFVQPGQPEKEAAAAGITVTAKRKKMAGMTRAQIVVLVRQYLFRKLTAGFMLHLYSNIRP
jgi:hypothetical protein